MRLVKKNNEDLDAKTRAYQKYVTDFNKADEAHMKNVMKEYVKTEQENILGVTGKLYELREEVKAKTNKIEAKTSEIE